METNFDQKVSVSTRVNIESLASIALFLEDKGKRPRTRSALVNSGIELLVKVMIENNLITPIESKEQAFGVLERMGLGFPKNTRGHSEIIKGLTAESLREFQEEIIDPEEINKAIQRELGGTE